MTTEFRPIEFTPGINKNTTPYHNEGGWVNCDKVRFSSGLPEKIGGWTRTSNNMFEGVARDILSWVSLESIQYVGIATHTRLYILEGGTYFDITPISFSTTEIDPFTTTQGSEVVAINAVGHNARINDYVIISNAVEVGGITLNGEYQITNVINTDNIEITHTEAATSDSVGGGSVSMDFLLGIGLEFNTATFGWGSGTYSSGTWGTSRSGSSIFSEMRQWSLADWGEDLLACLRGSRIFYWEENGGTANRAIPLTNAPERNNFIEVISEARHLVSFGCTDLQGIFDPLLVRWADSESLTVWDPAITNSAGDQRLDSGNFIVGAQLSRTDTLVFTDTAAYTMIYQGPPFIFGFNLIGANAGLIAQHASINVNGAVYWLSNNAFYRYDGVLRQLPCSIDDVVFQSGNVESINYAQKEMIHSGVNQEFDEIIWLYPAADSVKCNRYIIYNYEENVWYDGTIDRTTWEEPRIFDKPIATSSEGMLFTHEQGTNDDSIPLEAFVESGEFDLSDGDSLMFADKLVPDFQQVGNIEFTICMKKYPYSTEIVEKSYTVAPDAGLVNIRARGRQAKISIKSNTTNGNFQLGKPRLAVQPDGGR